MVAIQVLVDHPPQEFARAIKLEAHVGPLPVGQPVVADKGAREAVHHDGPPFLRDLRGRLFPFLFYPIAVVLLLGRLGVEDGKNPVQLRGDGFQYIVHLRLFFL